MDALHAKSLYQIHLFYRFSLTCISLVVQSILTGESDSVAKSVEAHASQKAVYQDKTCLLFSVSFLICMRTVLCFSRVNVQLQHQQVCSAVALTVKMALRSVFETCECMREI